jgi:probable HAF family extracellular repeat protein
MSPKVDIVCRLEEARMRRSRLLAGLAGAAVAAVVVVGVGPAPAEAQRQVSYQVQLLPSLGGQLSSGAGINDRNWVTGASDLAGDLITHAALWRGATVTDLGTLGGENSAVVFASHSDRFVVGVSETGVVNPDGEVWSCNAFFVGAPTHHDCVGFVWQNGHMIALPVFPGGHNGFAAGSNRLGQIVGWAENRTVDPSCVSPQVRQFRAALWEPRTHSIRELVPLPGDSTSAAVAINDLGQVVGISGACGTAVGGVSATHAVLWDRRGDPHDLGNIGGTQWNTPVAINDRGEVVGFANVPGGATPANLYPHAFVWTARTGMRDLETLSGDVLSEGLGLNDRGEIVGESCQAHLANCRAVLWEHGKLVNLNDAVYTTAMLVNAGDINDAGVITGTATSGTATVAYLARPVGGPACRR